MQWEAGGPVGAPRTLRGVVGIGAGDQSLAGCQCTTLVLSDTHVHVRSPSLAES